jgi:hypothetical protein
LKDVTRGWEVRSAKGSILGFSGLSDDGESVDIELVRAPFF